MVPGYKLHLESERSSVKVETWVTEGAWGVLHHVSVLEILLCCLALPSVYIAYFQEMSPELLGSWQNTAPCECWGHLPAPLTLQGLRPWHLPSNGQVHFLNKKYCWLSLLGLRAASIWNPKGKVPLQGAFCLLCSPAAQEKQSPAVLPRSGPWWVLCCGHGQEPERGKFAGWILSLSCDFIWIFTPQKSVL